MERDRKGATVDVNAKAAAAPKFYGPRLLGLWLFLPSVAVTLSFSLYPVAYAVFTSLYKAPYMHREAFVGLANYVQFISNAAARAAIVHSLVFVFGSLVLTLPLGTALALALNKPFAGKSLLQALIILPWVITLVVVGLLWGWLLNPQYGLLAYIGSLVGLQLSPLSNPAGAMMSLITASVWQSYPYAFLLVLAALQSIPNELYEAAAVDGAWPVHTFFYITLPELRSTLLVVMIVLGMHYFNVVTLPLIMTDGGPFGSTNMISLEVFHQAFTSYRTGYASAIAVYMFVFNAMFSVIYFLSLRKGYAEP
jgi:multiple sugar transport system permease protein